MWLWFLGFVWRIQLVQLLWKQRCLRFVWEIWNSCCQQAVRRPNLLQHKVAWRTCLKLAHLHFSMQFCSGHIQDTVATASEEEHVCTCWQCFHDHESNMKFLPAGTRCSFQGRNFKRCKCWEGSLDWTIDIKTAAVFLWFLLWHVHILAGHDRWRAQRGWDSRTVLHGCVCTCSEMFFLAISCRSPLPRLVPVARPGNLIAISKLTLSNSEILNQVSPEVKEVCAPYDPWRCCFNLHAGIAVHARVCNRHSTWNQVVNVCLKVGRPEFAEVSPAEAPSECSLCFVCFGKFSCFKWDTLFAFFMGFTSGWAQPNVDH